MSSSVVHDHIMCANLLSFVPASLVWHSFISTKRKTFHLKPSELKMATLCADAADAPEKKEYFHRHQTIFFFNLFNGARGFLPICYILLEIDIEEGKVRWKEQNIYRAHRQKNAPFIHGRLFNLPSPFQISKRKKSQHTQR